MNRKAEKAEFEELVYGQSAIWHKTLTFPIDLDPDLPAQIALAQALLAERGVR